MKIIFFSHDESIEELAESIHNHEWAFCAGIDELIFELDQDTEEDRICLCLDFDSGVKEIDKFLKKVLKTPDLIKLGISSRENLKLIRKHQKSKLSCHQYLLKPLELKGLASAINDHLLSVYIEENNLTEEGDEVAGAPSIQILATPHKALHSLDEEKEDYDTTKSRIVIPEGFRTDGRSVIEGANSIEDEIADEDDEEETFFAQEFKMDDEVKSLVDKHRKGSTGLSFGEDPINDRIQAKFDAVFKNNFYEDGPVESGQTGSISFGEDSDPVEDDSPSISFDLGEDEPEPISKNTNKDPVEAMTKKTGTSEGLEFNLDEETDLVMGSDDESSAPKTVENADDGEGLDFSFGDDNDDDLLENNSTKKAAAQSASADDDEDGLNFDMDDSILETSSKPSSSDDEDDDGGFEFDLDSEIETTTKPKAAAKEEKTPEGSVKTSTKTLDSIEDEEDGLSFSLSDDDDVNESAVSVASETTEEEFSELSFDEATEDENMEATKVASIDTSSFNRGEESTNDHLERTISEIVQGPIRSDSPVLSDEDKTGDFDLAELVEEDAISGQNSEEKGEEDFSFDAIEESADKTAQTVIATGTLSALHTDSNSTSTQTEDLAAELFDEAEDLFSTGGGAESSHPLEQEIADERTEVGFSLSDPGLSNPAAATQSNSSNARLGPQSRLMSSIGEDELLRLQSTIRHLREEREESLTIINNLKKEVKLIEQDGLGTKAELDEAKIEISILKKRHLQEVEELRYQLKLSDEKKQIYEERCKNYQKEFDRLNHKVRIEFNQVKQREKELESQLELVSMDSESQVKSRDTKILELKRKIDALEFNMENVTIREQKTKEDKVKIEERMNKIMSTLRGSIKLLEEDIDLTEDLKNPSSGQTRNKE